MSEWEYICGELRTRSSTRVYRKDGIGMVQRWRGNRTQTRYFIWALPDSSPEYEADGYHARAIAAVPAMIEFIESVSIYSNDAHLARDATTLIRKIKGDL